jgi:hypothetical protein
VKVLAGSKFAMIGLTLTAFGFPRMRGSDLSSFFVASF